MERIEREMVREKVEGGDDDDLEDERDAIVTRRQCTR